MTLLLNPEIYLVTHDTTIFYKGLYIIIKPIAFTLTMLLIGTMSEVLNYSITSHESYIVGNGITLFGLFLFLCDTLK